jgi:hypothetical protein
MATAAEAVPPGKFMALQPAEAWYYPGENIDHMP